MKEQPQQDSLDDYITYADNSTGIYYVCPFYYATNMRKAYTIVCPDPVCIRDEKDCPLYDKHHMSIHNELYTLKKTE